MCTGGGGLLGGEEGDGSAISNIGSPSIPGAGLGDTTQKRVAEELIKQAEAKKAAAEDQRRSEAPTPLEPGSGEAKSATDAARTEETRRSKLRRGRRSTVLTSPFGVTEQAQTRRKSLLGE